MFDDETGGYPMPASIFKIRAKMHTPVIVRMMNLPRSEKHRSDYFSKFLDFAI